MRRGAQVTLAFLAILSHLSSLKCEKLTAKENEDRLINCGLLKLSEPDQNGPFRPLKDSWIVAVFSKNKKKDLGKLRSLASFISPRHIVTSAQPIISDDKKWVMDGEVWDGIQTDGIVTTVPDKYAKNLKVVTDYCLPADDSCDEREFEAEHAWILDITQKDFPKFWAVMVVEVKATDRNYACVADYRVPITNGSKVHAYGYEYTNDLSKRTLEYRSDTITSFHSRMIKVKKYYRYGDRGGPMVMSDTNQSTVIGIGASPGWKDSSTDTFFFNLKYYEAQFCDLLGICPPSPVGLPTLLPPPPPSLPPINSSSSPPLPPSPPKPSGEVDTAEKDFDEYNYQYYDYSETRTFFDRRKNRRKSFDGSEKVSMGRLVIWLLIMAFGI